MTCNNIWFKDEVQVTNQDSHGNGRSKCTKYQQKEPKARGNREHGTRSSLAQKKSPKCRFIGAVIIVIHLFLTCTLFLGFECRKYYDVHFDIHILIPCFGILIACTVYCLLLTAIIMDPGVFPRLSVEGQELEAQCYNKERLKPDFNLETGVRRKINLYGKTVEANYCFECRHFKDLRTRHCKICDRCIVRHDHHCIILGCCVGIRNFAVFYYLQVFLFLFYLYVLIHSLFILFINLETKGIYTSLLSSPSVWLIVLTNLTIIATGLGHVILFPFTYCYLMKKDRTSREMFFVIEAKGVKCKCIKIEKRLEATDGSDSNGRNSAMSILKNYLCIAPPSSLLQRYELTDRYIMPREPSSGRV
ncbi:unnamed protein product [Allacma fusca]|uniref:Palmitoyltransferase n=1 Tax=Allacma fusca TaxID=39272 RepID=A0A8J2PED3_9HEXA|nr:unnamed protein product [Allacma fusca]